MIYYKKKKKIITIVKLASLHLIGKKLWNKQLSKFRYRCINLIRRYFQLCLVYSGTIFPYPTRIWAKSMRKLRNTISASATLQFVISGCKFELLQDLVYATTRACWRHRLCEWWTGPTIKIHHHHHLSGG